jgi:hypothetical protein
MPANADLARISLDAWNEHGLRALSDGWWHDDIAWHELPTLPDRTAALALVRAERRRVG